MSPWDLNPSALQEPWRLWTGQIAHWGLDHAAVNFVACALPLALLDAPRRKALLMGLPVLLPLLSLALLPGLQASPYRGASGLACLLWAASGCGVWASGRWRLGGMLLALLGLKLFIEAFFGIGPLAQDAQWRVFPQAHRWGALMGLGVGLLWRPWRDFEASAPRADTAAPTNRQGPPTFFYN